MALTTVFISKKFYQLGANGSDNAQFATCSFQFTPPEAVADHHCIVVLRQLMTFSENPPADGETLMLSSTWTQPRSVSYVDTPYTPQGGGTSYRENHDQLNRYLGITKGLISDPSYPRALIYMPSGPHEVTFTVSISHKINIGDIENVSFFLELVPVD